VQKPTEVYAKSERHSTVAGCEFTYPGIAFTSDRWRIELSNNGNLSVLKSVVVAILTYGHEPLVMTKNTLSQVQAADMRVLRKAQGVILSDKATHVLQLILQKKLNAEMMQCTLQFSCHRKVKHHAL